MIRSVADFIRYFEGVRRRTWVAVDRVTPALVGWRPRPDEWSCGAIVRHGPHHGAQKSTTTGISLLPT